MNRGSAVVQNRECVLGLYIVVYTSLLHEQPDIDMKWLSSKCTIDWNKFSMHIFGPAICQFATVIVYLLADTLPTGNK